MEKAGRVVFWAGAAGIACNLPLVWAGEWFLAGRLGIEMNTYRVLRLHTSCLLAASLALVTGHFAAHWPRYRHGFAEGAISGRRSSADPGRSGRFGHGLAMAGTAFCCLLFLGYYLHLALDFPLERLIYREDGILESMTAILFFCAAGLLGAKGCGKGARSVLVFGVPALICLVIAMEEISWGQRLFLWKTPEYLTAVNFQNETNLHNLFNPSWPVWYQAGALAYVWLVALGFHLHALRPETRWLPLFPHPRLAGPAVILAVAALVPSHELMEELASVLAFLHAVLVDRGKVPDRRS